MGVYTEYLDKNLSFQDLTAERKAQLQRIASLRQGHDILVYASDFNKSNQAPIAISYDDLLPVSDQLANLSGAALDVILETPGGSAEIAEDIIKLIRRKYVFVSFIVPGMAKSAGTIMVMAGDEILLDAGSSLGPIDAQIQWENKTFSADAFLKGLEKIKEEVESTNSLNRAYIPILQRISPGEIQHAENALAFAGVLVARWLQNYKFKTWGTHSSTGATVTESDKALRASEIASALCDHGRWLTHGRSIKLADLEELGLRITDFEKDAPLADAIRRYSTLLQMTFATTMIYKLFETCNSQIYRSLAPKTGPIGAPAVTVPEHAIAQLKCSKCGKEYTLQADFGTLRPLQQGAIRFPKDDTLICEGCSTSINLTQLRRQLEQQLKSPVIRE